MIGKKKEKSLISEVDDSRKIVYDFRRRTKFIFENYRAVGYKTELTYELNKLLEEDHEIMERLFAAGAVDAGNNDCLIERIIGPVISGLIDLDDQSVRHIDFYTRQGERAVTDSADIDKLLKFWREKEMEIKKEHEHTQMLWNKYNFKVKEDYINEEP